MTFLTIEPSSNDRTCTYIYVCPCVRTISAVACPLFYISLENNYLLEKSARTAFVFSDDRLMSIFKC